MKKSFSALLLLGLLCLLTSMEAGTGRNGGRRWKTKPTTPSPTTTTTWTPSPTTDAPTPEPPTYGWDTTTTTEGWDTTTPEPPTSSWQTGGKSSSKHGGKSKSKSASGWKIGNNGKSKSKSNSKSKSKSSSGAWKKSSSGGSWKKSSEGTWYKPPTPVPPQHMCPVGLAQIWFGDVHSIPGGFQICDGSNGTPDLRDRLVIGAGSQFAFGNSGGAASVALSAAQLAPHTHGAGSLATNEAGNHNHHLTTSINEGGHSHGFHLEAASAGVHKHKIDLQTGSGGDHDHTFDAFLPVDYNSNSNDEVFGVPVDKVDKDESYAQTVASGGAHQHSVYGYTQMGGGHTHSISGNIGGATDGKHYHHINADTGSGGTHSHSVSGSTGSTGAGAAIDIMNPYHSLYFICCVGKQHKAGYY